MSDLLHEYLNVDRIEKLKVLNQNYTMYNGMRLMFIQEKFHTNHIMLEDFNDFFKTVYTEPVLLPITMCSPLILLLNKFYKNEMESLDLHETIHRDIFRVLYNVFSLYTFKKVSIDNVEMTDDNTHVSFVKLDIDGEINKFHVYYLSSGKVSVNAYAGNPSKPTFSKFSTISYSRTKAMVKTFLDFFTSMVGDINYHKVSKYEAFTMLVHSCLTYVKDIIVLPERFNDLDQNLLELEMKKIFKSNNLVSITPEVYNGTLLR
ncbi:hypothetical protein [Proteus mirabilis]|uniref:hypothetical protein n=1 Tax=Proteus mirabilis TaxID=584 RepID=UPI0034D5FC3C